MQIGEPMLQLLLYKKAQSEQNKIIPEKDTLSEAVNTGSDNSSTAIVTSQDYKIANDFAMSNLSENQRISTAIFDTTIVVNSQAVTISSLSDAEISKIKQVIYDLHHPTTPPSPPSPETPTTPADGEIGFMNDFSSVDEMFDYISVDKSAGLDSRKLWELTQRDDWEERNYNFFGNLNHSFNQIDTNGDDILSYDEISNFIGDRMQTANEYLDKVEQYSNQLQTQFASMSAQQKLDFAIARTREYLQQVGLSEQLQALDRLLREGKLGFKDLNPGKTYGPGVSWTLGAYTSWRDENGNWSGDDPGYDSAGNYHDDLGLFLDQYYYCDRNGATWYDLVSTLVHELTHATASFHKTDETVWGEYAAYQTGEDYLDSIGRGEYSGSNERTGITNHIDQYYNVDGNIEPVPTGKWWTYGDYA